MQIFDSGLAKLAKIVGQDFGRQSYGNAFGTLGQEQRELDGERHGLLLRPSYDISTLWFWG